MVQLGERLRTIRQRIGYSQEAVARRADVSTATIQRLEADRSDPSLDTLVKVAAALDVTVAELLGEEEALPRKAAS